MPGYIISDAENTGGKGVVERRKFVSGGALGQVRRVEDVMCSEQVQHDGVGGERAQGWICRVPHCLHLSKDEIETKDFDWVKFPRRWKI